MRVFSWAGFFLWALVVSSPFGYTAEPQKDMHEWQIRGALAALRDADRQVQFRAALVLAEQRHKEAVPALIEGLGDESESIREAAVKALGQMGSAAQAAIPELIPLLK